jgi:hypothetical protein
MHMKETSQNKSFLFTDNFRYKGLIWKFCFLLNCVSCLVAGLKTKGCRYTLVVSD